MALYYDITTVTSPTLVPDCLSHVDGAINSGSSNFSCPSANFVSGDVGKTIVIEDAGAFGTDLRTTISVFNTPMSVTLSASAGSTVAYAYFSYGTNNKTAIDTAINAADLQELQLFISPGLRCLYSDTSDLTLPVYGIAGGGGIFGITCVYNSIKGARIDAFRCDNLTFSGVWHFDVEYLECRRLTLKGGSMGTYWNKFGIIVCGTFLIDCSDTEGINQNTFQDIKIMGLYASVPAYHSSPVRVGGLHITGGTVTVPPSHQTAENNVFYAIDSATYGIDGTGGCQVLNDSAYNLLNIIHMWYAERGHDGGTPPSPYIEGNWHIVGSTIDSDGSHLRISDRNHSLLARGTRNDGDFFAGGATNQALGGEWDIVKVVPSSVLAPGAVGLTMPYCMEIGSFITVDTAGNPNGCPSNIQKLVTLNTTNAGTGYESINIYVNFDHPQTVVGCLWYTSVTSDTVDNFEAVCNDDLAFPKFATVSVYKLDLGGGVVWKLLRFVLPEVSSYLILYINTQARTIAKSIGINSFFITNQKTALLPTRKTATIIKGSEIISSSTAHLIIPIPVSASAPYLKGTVTVFVKTIGGSNSASGVLKIVFSRVNGAGPVIFNGSGDVAIYFSAAPTTSFSFSNDPGTGDLRLDTPTPTFGSQIQVDWQIDPDPYF